MAAIPVQAAMLTRTGDRLLGFLARAVENLTNALLVSALIHVALVFGLRPIVPVNPSQFENPNPPLDVVLVNKRTLEKPLKADVLAQANLAGGGDVDENRVASSPLPASAQDSPAHEAQELNHRVEAVQQQAQALMQRLKSDYQTPESRPEAAPEAVTPAPVPNNPSERSLEMTRLAGQIQEQWSDYQKRPRKMFVGARAKEYSFARYVEDWRMKVERIGNQNYPEAARRERIYGSLILEVCLNPDGSLYEDQDGATNPTVVTSSKSKVLDSAAIRIVEMSAPFAAFSAGMRETMRKSSMDVFCISRTWSFTRNDLYTTSQ